MIMGSAEALAQRIASCARFQDVMRGDLYVSLTSFADWALFNWFSVNVRFGHDCQA